MTYDGDDFFEPEVIDLEPGNNCCPDCGDPDCYGTCCDYDYEYEDYGDDQHDHPDDWPDEPADYEDDGL